MLDRLFAALPDDAIVTTDVGQHQMWAAQRAQPAHPRNYATSAGLGAMGFGFPAAIGAPFANPGTPVYAIVGDGGFQMCLPELATLRRYGVPVKIVLIDNQNLGHGPPVARAVLLASATRRRTWPTTRTSSRSRAPTASTRSPSPRPSHADDAIARFVASRGPALLHCACHPTENVWPMIPAGMTVDDLMEARA